MVTSGGSIACSERSARRSRVPAVTSCPGGDLEYAVPRNLGLGVRGNYELVRLLVADHGHLAQVAVLVERKVEAERLHELLERRRGVGVTEADSELGVVR